MLKRQQPISINELHSPPISAAVLRVIIFKELSMLRFCTNVLFFFPRLHVESIDMKYQNCHFFVLGPKTFVSTAISRQWRRLRSLKNRVWRKQGPGKLGIRGN